MEVGGVRTEPWIVIHAVKKSYSTEDQTVASAVQIHVPPNSVKKHFSGLAPNFVASLPGTLSMWQSKTVLLGSLAGWFNAGWVEIMGMCNREMFLCNVFFCYNRKQGAWVLTIGRGQTKSPFILTIHTFAEVELDGTDFLLKNSWQMTNMLLKSSDEDSFHQTHCLPAGSNSY